VLLSSANDLAGQPQVLTYQLVIVLTFMNLGDAPDDERNLRVEVLG
jgi:hypothetical protein